MATSHSAIDVSTPATPWPSRAEVLGVRISATTYDEAADAILSAARARSSALVDALSAHGLSIAQRDPMFRRMLNEFDVVAPDGQPARWALNRLHGAKLSERVYGPELMERLCARAAQERIGVYLYGGSPFVGGRLRTTLLERHPRLRIVGCESPPFRPLRPEEDAALIDRIDSSGAAIVFVGLGCPKQERFAHEHRDRIHAVQVCVGAAFDFLAGAKPMAPRWMQDRGLEWFFRLGNEPRRLWRRYLDLAPFAARFLVELLRAPRPTSAPLLRARTSREAGPT